MVTAEVTFSKQDLIGLKYPMEVAGVDWQSYKEISEELGESGSVLLTFNKGNLTFMPVTELREMLIVLVERFMTLVGLTTRTNILPTGKATMRSARNRYGVEPDFSYFVSSAAGHKIKNYVSDELGEVPDIVAEIDVFHSSSDKFRIYADFGVAEFWRHDGERLQMYSLQETGEYREIERSDQLPILTGRLLTEFLKRGLAEDQFTVLTDFQKRLQENE